MFLNAYLFLGKFIPCQQLYFSVNKILSPVFANLTNTNSHRVDMAVGE
ncbi:hypothetical protein NIES970_21570 [[Synechococcus] sp. NIES-970]|nr:hypothetical protein NIES970_21570 [[Synechococcus] sp. NIES-970]